jgi:anti-sigma regulatory factor (Ser/Thr protein kinase)
MPEIPLVPLLWRFPAHPASVQLARRAVSDALPTQLRPRIGDDLSLITSELVTNAIRYGVEATDDMVELVLWPADGHYWLAVSDPGAGDGAGAGAPVVGHPGWEAESGRGLLLVESLASAWAVRPRPARGRSVIAGMTVRGTG